MGNRVGALKRTKNKSKEEKMELELTKIHHKTQKEYKEILEFYLRSLQYKVGQGRAQRSRGIYFYNYPQELLNRLELLGGSLAAGNNGALPEYIQIAHRLRDIGTISNNQFNVLLRKYVTM